MRPTPSPSLERETQQVVARDEKWVPSADIVKISSTNLRLETDVPQKEVRFQVIDRMWSRNSTLITERKEDLDVKICHILDSPKSSSITSSKNTREDYQEYGLEIPNVTLNDTIKRSKTYQMFIKYSTGWIPPKKSKGKGSQGKKIVDDSQETVDVSKRVLNLNLVKKKHLLVDLDAALELDTPSAPKPKPATSKPKLKGAQSLTPAEKEAADIMQALKECKKTSRMTPEGDADAKEVDLLILYSDTQDTDDEDDETESDEDDIYKYKIRVRKDEDVEMINSEFEESGKGGKEDTDAAKEDVEKTEETKDDSKKAELPPTSSSLSISSGFGDQFLKLSSDTSLVGTIKDTTDAEINSLLDIKIQSEKSASEIIKIKREQTEKQKTPKFTIKSTDKAACKEYDQKNALNQTMHANKSFNKNPANHKLYHALMEALIDVSGKSSSQLENSIEPMYTKEDINQKYLRSLPPSWSQIALIMRNKPDIDEVDIDDLYNNLRVYENELKRSSVEILGLVLLGGFNLVYLLKCHDSSLLLSCSTHQTVPHVRMRIFSRWNGVVLEGLEFRWAGGYVDCQSKDMFIQRHEEIWTFKGKNDLFL
ncbi:hypothetical protein Tco_1145839 [Tanacetum coccineum]